MPWNARLDSSVVHVTYEGLVPVAEIRESAVAVIELMKQGDTGLVLADFAGATRVETSTTDIVGLPQLFKALGLDRPFREAIVAPPAGEVRDQAEFYETVCANRGIPVRVFRDRDAAQQWLTA